MGSGYVVGAVTYRHDHMIVSRGSPLINYAGTYCPKLPYRLLHQAYFQGLSDILFNISAVHGDNFYSDIYLVIGSIF